MTEATASGDANSDPVTVVASELDTVVEAFGVARASNIDCIEEGASA